MTDKIKILIKKLLSNITGENFRRGKVMKYFPTGRCFSPTKIFYDEVFPDKVTLKFWLIHFGQHCSLKINTAPLGAVVISFEICTWSNLQRSSSFSETAFKRRIYSRSFPVSFKKFFGLNFLQSTSGQPFLELVQILSSTK